MADRIQSAAGADINPRVRDAFQARYPQAKLYDTSEGLLADPDVEAVWIATPNRFPRRADKPGRPEWQAYRRREAHGVEPGGR